MLYLHVAEAKQLHILGTHKTKIMGNPLVGLYVPKLYKYGKYVHCLCSDSTATTYIWGSVNLHVVIWLLECVNVIPEMGSCFPFIRKTFISHISFP